MHISIMFTIMICHIEPFYFAKKYYSPLLKFQIDNIFLYLDNHLSSLFFHVHKLNPSGMIYIHMVANHTHISSIEILSTRFTFHITKMVIRFTARTYNSLSQYLPSLSSYILSSTSSYNTHL